MIKRLELSDPTSCLNRAKEDELVFVLLSRDPAAPAAIRAWVAERLQMGKNTVHDAQNQEAIWVYKTLTLPTQEQQNEYINSYKPPEMLVDVLEVTPNGPRVASLQEGAPPVYRTPSDEPCPRSGE